MKKKTTVVGNGGKWGSLIGFIGMTYLFFFMNVAQYSGLVQISFADVLMKEPDITFGIAMLLYAFLTSLTMIVTGTLGGAFNKTVITEEDNETS